MNGSGVSVFGTYIGVRAIESHMNLLEVALRRQLHRHRPHSHLFQHGYQLEWPVGEKTGETRGDQLQSRVELKAETRHTNDKHVSQSGNHLQ